MDSTGQRGFQPIWDKDKTKINPVTKRVRFVWLGPHRVMVNLSNVALAIDTSNCFAESFDIEIYMSEIIAIPL